jgi:hypothetical protein
MHSPSHAGPALALACLSASAPFSANALGEDFQGSTHKMAFDAEPLLYSSMEAGDPVAKLSKTLRANRTAGWKPFHPEYGYLPAILEMLDVPAASQMLVFSKTSVQRHNIEPGNPRALYFSDSVYVGYIPGAPQLEIASVDPVLGTVFYTVNQDRDEPVRFRRSNDCLNCHAAARSMGASATRIDIAAETDGPMSGTVMRTRSSSSSVSPCQRNFLSSK